MVNLKNTTIMNYSTRDVLTTNLLIFIMTLES